MRHSAALRTKLDAYWKDVLPQATEAEMAGIPEGWALYWPLPPVLTWRQRLHIRLLAAVRWGIDEVELRLALTEAKAARRLGWRDFGQEAWRSDGYWPRPADPGLRAAYAARRPAEHAQADAWMGRDWMARCLTFREKQS